MLTEKLTVRHTWRSAGGASRWRAGPHRDRKSPVFQCRAAHGGILGPTGRGAKPNIAEWGYLPDLRQSPSRSPSAPVVERLAAQRHVSRNGLTGMHGEGLLVIAPLKMPVRMEGTKSGLSSISSDLCNRPWPTPESAERRHKEASPAPDLINVECPVLADGVARRLRVSPRTLARQWRGFGVYSRFPPRPPREFAVFRRCEDVSD